MSILLDKEKVQSENSLYMQEQLALKRYIERMSCREKTLLKLQTKTPLEVDSTERVALRKAMLDPKDKYTLESLIDGNDLLPINYLERGLIIGKAVCRIKINNGSGRRPEYGTGFLVSPNLLLTNNHVLPSYEISINSSAQFNYEEDLDFNERKMQEFKFAPDVFFMTNAKLDFTLVAVNEKSTSGTDISDFGYIPLIKQTGKVLLGEYVSIIQHPEGGHKSIVLRENKITDIFDNFIHYTADTCPGSSGSVVCNDNWNVIALHHASIPDKEHLGQYIANEGIRISRILQYIEENKSFLNNQQQELIKNLSHDITVNSSMDADDIAEDFSLERFESLTGHNPKFLGEHYEIPHPKLRADLENDVAKTINGEKILNYTHFSIVMSKSRRLAFYTVVDIDGNQLKNEERNDDWRYDPRIDHKFQCGEELYRKNNVDKGHLVRRRDPVWGNDSNKANEDTFHFTNASPQHKTFNQSKHLWLGLEDYLLNNVRENSYKAIIFNGPVFRENDIIYRGVKIPEEFWKVAVVVKDDGEISATAYIVSQKEFLNNLEKSAPGEFRTFQVKVSIIEALTGLDFFNLRNHDPLEGLESTTFGRVIESLEDIQL